MIRGLRRIPYPLGFSLSLLLMLAGCHSAGMQSTTTTTPAVTISFGTVPASLSLTVGQTYQFTATVSNSTNTAVTYAVNGVTGGNSTVGTISVTGLYTAPALVPNPQAVTITATSQADTTKSVSTPVTINISFSVTLAGTTSTSTSLQVTGTQQLSATIVGTTQTGVTWAVNGIQFGNSTVGAITATGLYTAPQYPPSPSTVTITGTSAAYNSMVASVTITVLPPPISVTVNPTALSLQVNGTVQFTDMVTTTANLLVSPAVTWGVVSPGSPGVSIYGFITSGGLFTAPPTPPIGALNPVPIYVVSQEDPTKYAISYVTITTAPVPLTISTNSLPNGVANSPGYSAQLSAYGGAQPYAWSITAGSLPTGLVLNTSTGVVTGTPTTAGTSNFTVTVTDQTSPTHETQNANLSITIIPQLSVATTALSNGAVGSAYNSTLNATGGVTAYAWSITSGSLPAGLSLNAATGAITGTPAAGSNGSYPLTFKVTDSGTPQQTQTFSTTITIYTGLTITTTSLPNDVMGTGYNQSVGAVGGTPSYTFSLASGSGPLPPPLTINSSTGAITGTPSTAGTYNFTVQVTDSSTPTQTKTQALSIIIYTPLIFPAVVLPNGVVGTAYTTTNLAASGGTTSYTWSETGALPSGLTLTPAGVLSGTPAAGSAGTYPITVKVTDSSIPAQVQTQNLSITIYTGLAITSVPLPNGVAGTAYSQPVTVAGGTAPYNWSLTGTPPACLSLANASTGTGTNSVTGNPAAGCVGTYNNFTLQVTDSSVPAQTKTQNETVIIYSALSFTAPALPGGAVNTVYTTTLTASAGTSPYTYSIVSGSLPPGLTLSPLTPAASASIAGTPTTAGTYNFKVQVQDSSVPAQQVQTATLSITIYPLLAITSAALPNGVAGTAYSQPVTVAGGTAPYNWSFTGTPPACLSLASASTATGTNSVTGNPAAGCVGTYNFTLQVTDSSVPAQTKTQNEAVIIYSALTFPTVVLPSGAVGTAYTTTNFSASGGTPSYTWSETGALPSGMTLTAAGVLSGTPAGGSAGTYPITVKVTDSSVPPQVQTQNLSISIYTGLTITTGSPLPYGIVGQAYNGGSGVQLAAAGGSGNYSWSVTVGSLPTGMPALPTSGLISGTPSAAATYNFTVQVMDTSTSQTLTKGLSILVATPLSFPNPGPFSGGLNTAFNQTASASGGTTPLTWSDTSGALPLASI